MSTKRAARRVCRLDVAADDTELRFESAAVELEATELEQAIARYRKALVSAVS